MENSNEEEERVSCCFCHSNNYQKYDEVEGRTIVKCSKCGFCFTNPRPKVEFLSEFYTEEYFRDAYDLRFDNFYNGDDNAAHSPVDYQQRITDIETHFERRGKVLEIGTANGNFLNALKQRGWKISAVEISKEAVELAKKIFDIDMFQGFYEDFETDEKFDVICMYQSLEHVPNPRFVLEKAYSQLNSGGIMVVEVPNLDSFDMRISQERRRLSYDLPRHLSHFNPSFLKKEMEKIGFKILDVDLYYPDFILKLFKESAQKKVLSPDQSAISQTGSFCRSGVELPLAKKMENWKLKLLKGISRAFPGWRFTIIARKSPASSESTPQL